jgi:hypothetical protein
MINANPLAGAELTRIHETSGKNCRLSSRHIAGCFPGPMHFSLLMLWLQSRKFIQP